MTTSPQLISSLRELNLYIPAGIQAVKGEQSILDKLAPALAREQAWLERYLLPPELMARIVNRPANNPLRLIASRLVAYLAFARSLPMLDLVLTPNGFAVVSNSNLAPASRDRVDALERSLFNDADLMIADLVDMLRPYKVWRESDQARLFDATLFFNPRMIAQIMKSYDESFDNPPLWSAFFNILPDIEVVESSLALKFFSEEQMAALRSRAFADILSPVQAKVCVLIRSIVADSLPDSKHDLKKIPVVIELIRRHPQEFKEWHASEQGDMFLNPTFFKNDKRSTGYFF